jgi:hypothetical protein
MIWLMSLASTTTGLRVSSFDGWMSAEFVAGRVSDGPEPSGVSLDPEAVPLCDPTELQERDLVAGADAGHAAHSSRPC